MSQHYLQIIVDSDKVNHLTIHPFSIKPDFDSRRVHHYKTSSISNEVKSKYLSSESLMGSVFFGEVVESCSKSST